MSSQVSFKRITERVSCLEAISRQSPDHTPGKGYPIISRGWVPSMLPTVLARISQLAGLRRATQKQEEEALRLLPPATQPLADYDAEHPDYLGNYIDFNNFFDDYRENSAIWSYKWEILCQNLKAYNREETPNAAPRSGELHTAFQHSLIEAVEEANNVHRLCDTIFQKLRGYGPNAPPDSPSSIALRDDFGALQTRAQLFAPFPTPTLNQETDIFRFIGVRKIYVQKVLEQLGLHLGPARLVSQYLALDIKGIERDTGEARSLCVYFHTQQYPEISAEWCQKAHFFDWFAGFKLPQRGNGEGLKRAGLLLTTLQPKIFPRPDPLIGASLDFELDMAYGRAGH